MISDQLRVKQGPLARVWLASHWEKKVSKSQFLQTNLEKTIETITTNQEEEPLTLRVSGQLLLGVVRIYSRKTRYLLEDCNEALTKIKLAFKKGEVNMPDIHHSIANVNTITLQDKLTEFDILLPDLPFNANISAEGYDPIFDSLGDISMSQDITLGDLQNSFSFGNYGAERGLSGGVEVGRRDNEPGLTDTGFDMDAIADPMKDMNINDANFGINDDGVDFDFNLNDGFDYTADNQQEATQFELPALPGDSLDTLMEVGIVEDDNMFGMDTSVEPTVRRRKRLVVDKITEIPQEDLRNYTMDTSAIVSTDVNLTNMKTTKALTDITKPFGGDSLSTELDEMFSNLNRKRRASDMAAGNLPKEPRLEDAFTPGDAFAFEDNGFDYDVGGDINQDALNQFEVNDNLSDYDPFTVQNTQSFNSYTRATLEKIDNQLTTQEQVNFSELATPSTHKRAEAARMFYDVLLLSTKDKIKIKQDRPFGEIQISSSA